jgi:nucleotide-binding universal stress UspA family protein
MQNSANSPIAPGVYSVPRMTPAPQTILCGTDFSDAAAGAVEVASALARRLGEPLVLAHAVNDQSRAHLPGELRESLSLYARARLHEERERLHRENVKLLEEFHIGSPDAVLLEQAENHSARLCVLATSRRSSLARKLRQGLTERVAEAAHVPTVVVRDPAPLVRWAEGERRLRVLVGADFSYPSEAALRWVHWLQQTGPCDVVVAYLEPIPMPYLSGDQYYTMLMEEMAQKTARVRESYFRQRIRALLGRSRVRVRVEEDWGRSDAHLIQLAADEHIDLIVIATHSRQGWQRLAHHSVSRGVLRYAPLNVACVPSQFIERPGVFSLHQQSPPQVSHP